MDRKLLFLVVLARRQSMAKTYFNLGFVKKCNIHFCVIFILAQTRHDHIDDPQDTRAWNDDLFYFDTNTGKHYVIADSGKRFDHRPHISTTNKIWISI